MRERIVGHLGAFERIPTGGDDLRRAAVALTVVADDQGEACFVISRRVEDLRSHGGQWAIPGGRMDAGETPEQTALRELHEEVGLDLPGDSALGQLDDFATRSGYLITPVVVWGAGASQPVPNPDEVAAVFRVPVDDLDEPGVPELSRIPESSHTLLSIPFEKLETTIHAPTAAMLFQFREVALHGRHTRVFHYEQPVFAWR
ncbi:MAG: CoA pyrophosphatase [bacterium]|nr:CoA pyrophosphatase [bacterium]